MLFTLGDHMRLSNKMSGIKFLSMFIFCCVVFIACPEHGTAMNAYSGYPGKKTVVIYIMGLAGTGKYTIAKKISSHGYKLVDNHLINNPIFSLLENDGEGRASNAATDKIDQIRSIVLEFMTEDRQHHYVLTNQLLDNPFHRRIYDEIMNAAKIRGSLFVPVRLSISSNERAKRIVQPDRGERFKITDAAEAYEPRKRLKVSHQNLLELDVTHLSADEAANKILQHVNTISAYSW